MKMESGTIYFFLFLLTLIPCIIAESSSTAAFLKIGSDEKEGNYLPKKKLKNIDAKQLNNAIHRMLLLEAHAEIRDQLPYGKLFDRPDQNIVVFIDGLSAGSSLMKSMPFLSKVFKSQSIPRFSVENRTKYPSSILQESLFRIDFQNLDEITCQSYDQSLYTTTACQTVSSDHVPQFFIENDENILEKESSMLSNLSVKLYQTYSSEYPSLHIVYLSSIRSIINGFEVSKDKVTETVEQIDAALQSLLEPENCNEDMSITAQIIIGEHLKDVSYPVSTKSNRRRLATTTSSTTTTATSTSSSSSTSSSAAVESDLTDIKQYQLNLWTGVFLALAVLFSIYGMVNMDIGRDSLLYAKFQADTSGKMD